ncbi:MAG: aspartate carbamoyltransferase, partial [Planctomycetes bacterium]|nr:aspartate carbamoyltransferase [Planctomycetota bacterium]
MNGSDDAASQEVRWNRKHLLGLEELTAEEITLILDKAAEFKKLAAQGETKLAALRGTVVANLFFEPSTRTRTSFGLAAKRLSADTVEFTASGSSVSKGETFFDTARNIEAMGVDLVVVRHSTPGAPHLLAKHIKSSVINAGDGTHEHPTQGLLDIFTIREHRGPLDKLTVTLVGDILHSRVARS